MQFLWHNLKILININYENFRLLIFLEFWTVKKKLYFCASLFYNGTSQISKS